MSKIKFYTRNEVPVEMHKVKIVQKLELLPAKERLQKMILTQGRPAVTSVIMKAKDEIRDYVSRYAQLSAIELDRILAKDPAYQMVRDLLEKELNYLKEIEF